MRHFVLIITAFLLVPSDTYAQDERAYVNPSMAENSRCPAFSSAVLVGETLYMSGTLGLVDGTVPEDASEESRVILNNMKAVLEQVDMTMDDLVYVQVFCSDVELYDVFNTEYRKFFTREFPARAFIGSGTLLRDARFEVQGIAVRRK